MRIALLTPTYARDLEHFKLLRASLEAAGCHWPHYVVVQTEHLALFKAQPWGAEVKLLASADVLPAAVEAERRRVAGYPPRIQKLRRSLNKRFGWFADASRDGWNAQQIIKLEMASRREADVWVTLDSDVVVVGEVRAESFARGETVALHSQPAETHAHFAPHWNFAARRLLKLPLPVQDYNYVAHPFAFAAGTTRALLQHIEALHAQPWWQVLGGLRANSLSEFSLYGIYAREIAHLKGLHEHTANAETFWIYTDAHRAQAAALVAQCFADPAINYLVIQSSRNHPIQPLAPVLQLEMARQQRAAVPTAPSPG